jgi:hypothetical protein
MRQEIDEMQRRANEAERERRLAESLGVTVRELRVLNNPLFSKSAVGGLGLDVENGR